MPSVQVEGADPDMNFLRTRVLRSTERALDYVYHRTMQKGLPLVQFCGDKVIYGVKKVDRSLPHQSSL